MHSVLGLHAFSGLQTDLSIQTWTSPLVRIAQFWPASTQAIHMSAAGFATAHTSAPESEALELYSKAVEVTSFPSQTSLLNSHSSHGLSLHQHCVGARLPWFPGEVRREHFGVLWLPQCSFLLSPRMWRKKPFNTHFILISFLPSPSNVE